ncbi:MULTISPECIES: hypothetical protein [unclassified Streptomyces]|uniref:hypothetical protein n=1 Tax=unclassified Streptomyces TaxID=2593676 RepID=UPI00225B80E5|nr:MULTISPECIES: hypothetical protein [unclassified Streptomyces]MCX4527318.1 hypothetical protein [Streptomyces sp. NBC_01551]MCX4542102.1 hypothetical protein [Streptomyces sp. NBC_01565]
MCSAETQAAALAALLSTVLGGAETRTEATCDRIRIEADLPGELAPPAHAALLSALAAGARYGHERISGGAETVWVEIDKTSTGLPDSPRTPRTPRTP